MAKKSSTSRAGSSRPASRQGKPSRPGTRPKGSSASAGVRRKAGPADWIAGARIRTLPLAIAPVALGTACAHVYRGFDLTLALLALAVALFLQIGTNYANDYSDGVRGTDRFRVGPVRLTGSGAARPRTVLAVAFVFFALAAAAGVAAVILSEHWWLLAVGAAAILAAFFYTGGPKPYGYYGLGELFVFVFFGLVATAGTMFLQAGTVTIEAWLSGSAAGFFACAVLMVNNLRDREQDAVAGKRTLSVLIGDVASRALFVVFVTLPFGVLVFFTLFYVNAYLVFFALLAGIPAIVITVFAKTAQELILALRLTTLTALLFGLGLAAAIAF